MIDIFEFGKQLQMQHSITDKKFRIGLTKILVDNNWFGIKPVCENNKYFIRDSDAEKLTLKLDDFIQYFGSETAQKLKFLREKISRELSKTSRLFEEYCTKTELEELAQYHLLDFLLYFAVGEITEADDNEIKDLLTDAFGHLPKSLADILTDFLNWLSRSKKTGFKNVYLMKPYCSKAEFTEAYEPLQYLEMLYYLFNADYIDENQMYHNAAQSKDYADTWLYLSLHFICGLRDPDLFKLIHPRLTRSPEDVLTAINNEQFPEDEAKLTMHSLMWYYELVNQKPNKTQNVSGVSSIHFTVPESVFSHMGKLFAIAEAHHQIQYGGSASDLPLIRRVSTYEQISKYMGDEIGELFLECNFHSIAANKSYLQTIESLTDDILETQTEFKVNGYMLAALARSHKGTYGEFARTTSIYLKDAKMSGHSAEFVARELFERGVLSFVPSMLLKMITDGQYDTLSVENQTQLIQQLHLSPNDIEKLVSLSIQTQKESAAIASSLMCERSKNEIIEILHRIGSGQSPSKQEGHGCILSAIEKECPYKDRSACIGCKYEMATKATLFILTHEFVRLKQLHNSSDNVLQKAKYKHLAINSVLPVINEMLEFTLHEYGAEAANEIEAIIKDVTHGK